MPAVTLVNEGKTLEVPEGTNLRKLMLKNGISPYSGIDALLNCRGNGLCGTCRVEVVDGKGAPAMTALEESALISLLPVYGRSVPKNTRLSCRIDVMKDISIKTNPVVTVDWVLTKERIAMTAIWTLFGVSFLAVMGRLLFEIATGR
jgi:ferredoxin